MMDISGATILAGTISGWICFGFGCGSLVFWLWSDNSRLRKDNIESRVRRITAEAALSFAANLPLDDRAEFIWQYHFGGTPAVGYPAWPQFLQARINVELDNRS
ncbi:hypothetical protein [Agrobacterium vitis]|uniref:Uncharacterized protein n=1 Tax=Agrobacterium vitis TaxID=373 RepID=A0AAE2RDG6_AGRVI|nr:hypothetical protein [Agrobacterium vitis]MBF2715692.1 hypothetical protein [Agrobacterium vitis]